jgi:hypothetical protein
VVLKCRNKFDDEEEDTMPLANCLKWTIPYINWRWILWIYEPHKKYNTTFAISQNPKLLTDGDAQGPILLIEWPGQWVDNLARSTIFQNITTYLMHMSICWAIYHIWWSTLLSYGIYIYIIFPNICMYGAMRLSKGRD